jgi:hypothetical protein
MARRRSSKPTPGRPPSSKATAASPADAPSADGGLADVAEAVHQNASDATQPPEATSESHPDGVTESDAASSDADRSQAPVAVDTDRDTSPGTPETEVAPNGGDATPAGDGAASPAPAPDAAPGDSETTTTNGEVAAATGVGGDGEGAPGVEEADSDTGGPDDDEAAEGAGAPSDDGEEQPAAAGSSPSDAAEIRVAPVARPPGASRQRAIRAGLSTLPVPEPGPSFWADLDAALAGQGHLAIAARPAIRPISEPPPLSQPRLGDQLTSVAGELAEGSRRAGSDLARGRSPNGGNRAVLLVVIAVLAGLLALGVALGGDEDPARPEGMSPEASTSTTLAGGEVTSTVPGPTTTMAPQVQGLGPDAPLTPAGIGPLQVGSTRRELQQRGVDTTVDQASFQSGEGRCFSGTVPAAGDLVLWFRSPDPDQGVGDPLDGELAAVSVTSLGGSPRPTESGLRLGATVEQVAGIHQGQLETVPGQAGEQVYLLDPDDGADQGVAFVTDGAVLIKIHVGLLDVVPQPETCPG